MIITIVTGKIQFFNDDDVVAKPSTADRTLIAGVRAPSPKKTREFILKSFDNFYYQLEVKQQILKQC